MVKRVNLSAVQVVVELGLAVSTEAFGVKLEGEVLRIPQALETAAAQGGLSIELLLCVLHTFPSNFCDAFGWTRPEFDRAMQGLIQLFEGKVDDEFLRPSPPQKFGTGALPPRRNPV